MDRRETLWLDWNPCAAWLNASCKFKDRTSTRHNSKCIARFVPELIAFRRKSVTQRCCHERRIDTNVTRKPLGERSVSRRWVALAISGSGWISLKNPTVFEGDTRNFELAPVDTLRRQAAYCLPAAAACMPTDLTSSMSASDQRSSQICRPMQPIYIHELWSQLSKQKQRNLFIACQRLLVSIVDWSAHYSVTLPMTIMPVCERKNKRTRNMFRSFSAFAKSIKRPAKAEKTLWQPACCSTHETRHTIAFCRAAWIA